MLIRLRYVFWLGLATGVTAVKALVLWMVFGWIEQPTASLIALGIAILAGTIFVFADLWMMAISFVTYTRFQRGGGYLVASFAVPTAVIGMLVI